eukprot:5626086-Alexandrium_andersonii.AAC.1
MKLANVLLKSVHALNVCACAHPCVCAHVRVCARVLLGVNVHGRAPHACKRHMHTAASSDMRSECLSHTCTSCLACGRVATQSTVNTLVMR